MNLKCFKAYDIRGRIPEELNENLAFRIGRAYALWLGPERVVVGRDVRTSSKALCDALADGLVAGGVEVDDLGLCGTEEVYFATFSEKLSGGIMVTASHNPPEYNGMKLVREGARPISGDSGLHRLGELVSQGVFPTVKKSGGVRSLCTRSAYIDHLLGYVDPERLQPFKVVVNAGNGCAGPVVDALEKRLPFTFVKVHHEPDGTFPHGIPNPLLPENRAATAEAVIRSGAQVGIAWDGDFDRCFLFDEAGRFIEGYYVVGLLAEAMLQQTPGSRIIHDPRLTWNTLDIVRSAGGVPIQSKTGHAFIKERMRGEDAVYGGEMSAHHYFRDFAYCDSGMIPWLLVLQLMSSTGRTLSDLVDERIALFPASGEINRRLKNPEAAIAKVMSRFSSEGPRLDHTDGLSMEFRDWRFNLRCSNTEPVLRLNVESRGNRTLMEERTAEILGILDGV
ncbi:MAG: phosphomannomutase [Syntrophotaleaceae bacterium]